MLYIWHLTVVGGHNQKNSVRIFHLGLLQVKNCIGGYFCTPQDSNNSLTTPKRQNLRKIAENSPSKSAGEKEQARHANDSGPKHGLADP